MKFALRCDHCHECTELPQDEGFDRDAVIDTFVTAHQFHLQDHENIEIVEHLGGALYRFAGIVGRPN